MALAEKLRALLVVALGMALEDRRGGDRHGRVEKDLHRTRQSAFFHPLAEEEEHFLCPFQRKCRDDDIAAASEGIDNRIVKLLDRRCSERCVRSP